MRMAAPWWLTRLAGPGAMPPLLLLLGLLCLMEIWPAQCADPPRCHPGFSSDHFIFTTERKVLRKERKLGTVDFIDCTIRKHSKYDVGDSRFLVSADGSLKAKRHFALQGPETTFSVTTWDVQGKKYSTRVTIRQRREKPRKHKRPILTFPETQKGLKRRKRDWVVPPINVPENQRGSFPMFLVQIKSNRPVKIFYSITGQGADTPPVGLFIIEKETGRLLVTTPLDREEQPTYTLQCHAVSADGQQVEPPMEVTVVVTDQNDNRPEFTQEVFQGFVREGVQPGTAVMNVTATDADDPMTDNAILGYSILKQTPEEPSAGLFTINKESGLISVIGTGLDRERVPQYTLIVQAADMEGKGLSTTATALIQITDSNDNAPVFDPVKYSAVAPENEVGFEVLRLSVTDNDEMYTPAWRAVYEIRGPEASFFSISTDPDSNVGILTTAKGLDYETRKQFVLQITAKNEEPFSVPLPTSTATVTVSVEDVNEAPFFVPSVSQVEVLENLPQGEKIIALVAQDPDKQQNQKLRYRIGNDPAKWVTVNEDTGIVTSNGNLDRESDYVRNNTYTIIVMVIDDGIPFATGTGTLLLRVLDVNDNGPVPNPRAFYMCSHNPEPQELAITDADLPPNTSPFRVELSHGSDLSWEAEMTGIATMTLKPKEELKIGTYNLFIRLYDAQDRDQVTVMNVTICTCEGNMACQDRTLDKKDVPIILIILGSVLGLLILILLLLLFLRRKKKEKEPLLLPEDDTRDNIFYYGEEGGGEEDQDYDLSQLHRGLDARVMLRNDVVPTLMPPPMYKPRPSNPDEIGNFIDENLMAADQDPTAPPYDSLLVFDYEGSGSEAASLSSLTSSNSSDDQDYDCLSEWGPRFRKLADMYGGDED
ncbi:EP-cadherin-like [Hyperolius riggenbachi]|uniref:EP-cadherin-like n=1 Tax=Hyperolius riggenbachi TaxID=752182 RepID=UPI0035A344BC